MLNFITKFWGKVTVEVYDVLHKMFKKLGDITWKLYCSAFDVCKGNG